MQNSTFILAILAVAAGINFSVDPKYTLLEKLMVACYLGNSSNSQKTPSHHGNSSWCPREFDGFACWHESPPSSEAKEPCPDYIYGFDPNRSAVKRCMADGKWYAHPNTSRPWADYTTCIDKTDLFFRSSINLIYVIGYTASSVALVVSVVIFKCFSSLYCTRIRTHIHMFGALAVNNLLWIIWYNTVVSSVKVLWNNELWCQGLHILIHYFMVASYIWMFCESIHLHVALVTVFVEDVKLMRRLIWLGWGLPLIIVAVYATVRLLIPGATDRCWMEQHDTIWIMGVPVLLCLMTSSGIMINVVRILLTKLHSTQNRNASDAAKKAAKAALILIPLFGIHFILMPLRPSLESPFEKPYQFISAIVTSFQGLCVAMIFCLTNNEVRTVIKDYLLALWHRRREEAIPMTAMTAGESLAHTRENVE